MTKVSIIVPVYNVENYIARCLDFCTSQTCEDIEIICVNDGSTDSSLDILEHYRKLDDRIKIVTKENGGLSSARNAGMDKAQGEYILFVDSDDFISQVAVEHLVNKAEQDNLDIVLFDYIRVKKENKTLVTMESINIESNKVFNIETLDGFLYNYITMSAWSKLYKTSFLKENQIRFDPGLIYEDISFFSKIYAKAKRISYLKEPLYSYTMTRDGQIMYMRDKKLFDIFEVYKISEETLRNAGYYEKCKHGFEMKLVTDTIWKFELIDSEFRPEFFKKIKENYKNIDYAYYRNANISNYMRHTLEIYKHIGCVNSYEELLKNIESGGKNG